MENSVRIAIVFCYSTSLNDIRCISRFLSNIKRISDVCERKLVWFDMGISTKNPIVSGLPWTNDFLSGYIHCKESAI